MLQITTHVSTTQRIAALTFDDGPDPEWTPTLLRLLAQYEARATFFMLGQAAQRWPRLVQAVAEAGHCIGNHSWDHPSFPALTGTDRRWQLRACARALAPYGEKLFRPPFGDQNARSCLDARLLGYDLVRWNVDAQDWCDSEAERMAQRLLQRLAPGSIVLLHDGLMPPHPQWSDRAPMLDALDRVLQQTQGQFQFLTIPQLFRAGPRHLRPWYQLAAQRDLPAATDPAAPAS